MNEQTETIEQSMDFAPVRENNMRTVQPDPEARTGTLITPQGCGCGSSEASAEQKPFDGGQISYVYAIGKVEARFPNLSLEMEFKQVISRKPGSGGTQQETFHAVLSNPDNCHLMRQMCWVLSIQGMESYLLVPRYPTDIGLLVDTIRTDYNSNAIDVVLGMRGPIAPPTMCNGLMVPIIIFDQIYSFEQDQLINAIPPPAKISREKFRPAAEELFNRIRQMTDNAGATDEHRALNYLAMRDPDIYAKTADKYAENFSLSAVDVVPSPLSSTRKIVDVVFAFTNRNSGHTEKFFVRVDVAEEFPFLVTKMSPYYDRQIGDTK